MNLFPLSAIEAKNVLDIGANVGAWSQMASSIWKDANFLMIEANPNCEDLLRQACTDRLDYKMALLGAEPLERVPFYTTGGISTGDSVYKELGVFYEDCRQLPLEMKTLEQLLGGRTFEVIKMDVQGSELDIIKGGLQIVDRSQCLILEVSDKPYNESAPLSDEVIDFMDRIGFDCHTVLEESSNGQRDIAFFRSSLVDTLTRGK